MSQEKDAFKDLEAIQKKCQKDDLAQFVWRVKNYIVELAATDAFGLVLDVFNYLHQNNFDLKLFGFSEMEKADSIFQQICNKYPKSDIPSSINWHIKHNDYLLNDPDPDMPLPIIGASHDSITNQLKLVG